MNGTQMCVSAKPGEWVKGKVVGSGSFGTVHLAMDKSNGALFVVKSAESHAGLASLENEAKILENLSSPHIVECIGKDLSNGVNGVKKLDLFIEYMAGGSLADVAKKFGGVLDERVIRLYTREILQGLKYLHNNGVVHSDLKCKNMLLGSSGNVKLADFGCAQKLIDSKADATKMGSCKSICGTPLWMAPEVLRNEGLDFAADIWSLGCTVIEMATGRPPWGDDISNPMAAVLMIACSNEPPRFPTQFSKEGLDFLSRCFDRNPKKRWTSEELLHHPFVSGKSKEGNLRKEEAFSPASVLDGGLYMDDYVSEESPDGRDIISRIPFSMRSSGERGQSSHRHHTRVCWPHQNIGSPLGQVEQHFNELKEYMNVKKA